MCDHPEVELEHVTPRSIVPQYSDNAEMGYWICHKCKETFDSNPRKEADEEINETAEVRKNLI